MQLARMQDIGGLRTVVGTVKKVRALETNYKNSRFYHELTSTKDYINEPKVSGYRSVHLVYKNRNPRATDYSGLYIEVQIRTRLQHAWATAVETMGTFLNHALKSSEGPSEWLSFFALAGSAFAHLENTPAVPGYENCSKQEAFEAVIDLCNDLSVRARLRAFAVAVESIHTDRRAGSFHLLVLDPVNKVVNITTFSQNNLEVASGKYAEIEKRISDGEHLQAVLVSAGPIDELKRAYPNYFLDTHEFIQQLNRIEKQLVGNSARKGRQQPSVS